MNLLKRKELLIRLGEYMSGSDDQWALAKRKATAENNWFIPEFIELSISNIVTNFLSEEHLTDYIQRYNLAAEEPTPKKVGVVMAGNIPLVGFHDVLCIFISGNYAIIKPSTKDEAMIRHLVNKIIEWDVESTAYFTISAMIPHCDAYIATGSNNSSRYFEYYFRKYPSIIRKNRTSVAILLGNETFKELEKLADDVFQYFGLGCRNVTKLYVPENYDFIPLLQAFNKYEYLINHHKYKNNYDYNLAIHILNNKYYMTNGSILLIEDHNNFSPIAQLHYEFYNDLREVYKDLNANENIQCVVGREHEPFGSAQFPAIDQFADKKDTMNFLIQINEL